MISIEDIFLICKILTLIWLAEGKYDSKNFEQIQLKMSWSKNICLPRSIPHKIFKNYILLKVFIQKMLFF
jgi:hypothetical protein